MMARATARLDDVQCDRVKALIEKKGLHHASRIFDICPDSLKVASLGGAISSGTVAKVVLKIRERDEAGKTP